MRIVRGEAEVADAFGSATREAEAGFKNPDVYLEKFVERPRHIEFQVLADKHGGVWTLGERECSLQRRHQKVIEEAPSPAMTPEQRQAMGEVIRQAMRETGYTSLGTLEFLMDEGQNLYFLEMNTRVQVEHPVTEMVTGLDLVDAADPRGRGREARPARHPAVELPRPRHRVPHQRRGPEDVRAVAGAHHRVLPARRGRACGSTPASTAAGACPPDYDSLLAKLIVHAPTRARGHRAHAPRARRVHRRRASARTSSCTRRCSPTTRSSAGTMTTRTIERMLAAG